MLAIIYLLLLGVVAFHLQFRLSLLASFRGPTRYLASLALVLFLSSWINFLLWATAGPETLYLRISWAVLLLLLFYFSGVWRKRTEPGPARLLPAQLKRMLGAWREWDGWFLFLVVFIVSRFYVGLDVDVRGNVIDTFNFIDTPFHLSVTNSFLVARQFPPVDLDMAPFPLKYHFISDFHVAHLARLGLDPLKGVWMMNVLSSIILVGVLWGTFKRWLGLPSRWIMLGGLIFLFLNTALLNLIHSQLFHRAFFDYGNPYYGLLIFPYFNFEWIQFNMLEPQRGLLFSMPVALLILNAAFGERGGADGEQGDRRRMLESFALVCLMPLAHIVAFAVLVPSLLGKLWKHFGWFLRQTWLWLPVFAIGVAQLAYLKFYGPPTNASFSAWSAASALPLNDFAPLPSFLRRAAFWFFTNGDFLGWGLFFALIAWIRHKRADSPGDAAGGPGRFLREWKGYFAVTLGFFALINVVRYSFDWGDSNKFVLFLNLALALLITTGAAQWSQSRHRYLSHALWIFFFILCIGPAAYGFYDNMMPGGSNRGKVLLFDRNSVRAAEWLRVNTRPGDLVLTRANHLFNFATALAGRPNLAGIYAEANPYRQDGRPEQIRKIYEEADFELMRTLGLQYVCISREERRRYRINPKWLGLIEARTATVFSAGGGLPDEGAFFILKVSRLK